MVTKIWEFQDKINHNSANIRDRAMNVAPNRGFSRSSNLPMSLKFTSGRPRLPWQRKFENFNGKMAKTRLIQEIEPQMLHQSWFSRSSNLLVSLAFTADRPPCFHGNENVKILTQN